MQEAVERERFKGLGIRSSLEAGRSATRGQRLLFVAEAVSLAHVGRPLQLARWAREAGYEVHFACGEAYADMARAEGFEPIPVTTIVPALFYKRLAQGKFFYSTAELESYVRGERELLERLQPGLVIGDFRLSLAISTHCARIPYLALQNAHWSPAAACRFPAPRNGLLGLLPSGVRERVFASLRPLAFRYFAAPLNRVRERFGLPRLNDFRELYTAGDWCAYLDLPELMPLANPLPKGHFFLGPVTWAPKVEFTAEAQRRRETLKDDKEKSPSASPRLRGELRSRPLAYVTLGSTGLREHLPAVLNALLEQGSDVVLSGVNEAEQCVLRKSVPGWETHVHAAAILDPTAVLQRAWLCVCHGGSGTVYQSLSHGVPLLCLPGNPDQALVAQAVTANGAGMALLEGLEDSVRLSEGLNALGNTPSFRLRAQKLAYAIARHNTAATWLRFLAQAVGKAETMAQLQPYEVNNFSCNVSS